MRTLVSSALAIATLGLVAVSPASATTYRECVGALMGCAASSPASFSRAAYRGERRASRHRTRSHSRNRRAASFNPSAMTAAHRSLPFGTKVRVTNRRNGRSVIVTINDRGPFVRGRVIDLSSGAAGVIGMRSSGVAPVSLQVLGRGRS
jgi:rare lipoprotein A